MLNLFISNKYRFFDNFFQFSFGFPQMLQYNADVTNNEHMKTLITKFWKHLLCIAFFFVGVWVFNHLTAWLGIFISVVAIINLGSLFFKEVAKRFEQIKD